jgi:hypothetical protein
MGGLLAADAGYDFGGGFGERNDGNHGLEVVEKCTAAMADFLGIGAVDAVADLGCGDS